LHTHVASACGDKQLAHRFFSGGLCPSGLYGKDGYGGKDDGFEIHGNEIKK
jgi:hypothetical protein